MHEKTEVRHLPAGKELAKASNKQIPFFSYASEERFRDLFLSLREDSQINTIYLVLMLSFLSRDIHAPGISDDSSQHDNSVLLPYPAGAETTARG